MSDDTPRRAPDPNIELVAVYQSGDEGQILVAKSLLDGEGIDYLVRGDGLQDLFGYGRLAIGFSNVVGPAEFLVRKDDADRARELLRDL
jgi:Putative prokaryotic signal transducing protein